MRIQEEYAYILFNKYFLIMGFLLFSAEMSYCGQNSKKKTTSCSELFSGKLIADGGPNVFHSLAPKTKTSKMFDGAEFMEPEEVDIIDPTSKLLPVYSAENGLLAAIPKFLPEILGRGRFRLNDEWIYRQGKLEKQIVSVFRNTDGKGGDKVFEVEIDAEGNISRYRLLSSLKSWFRPLSLSENILGEELAKTPLKEWIPVSESNQAIGDLGILLAARAAVADLPGGNASLPTEDSILETRLLVERNYDDQGAILSGISWLKRKYELRTAEVVGSVSKQDDLPSQQSDLQIPESDLNETVSRIKGKSPFLPFHLLPIRNADSGEFNKIVTSNIPSQDLKRWNRAERGETISPLIAPAQIQIGESNVNVNYSLNSQVVGNWLTVQDMHNGRASYVGLPNIEAVSQGVFIKHLKTHGTFKPIVFEFSPNITLAGTKSRAGLRLGLPDQNDLEDRIAEYDAAKKFILNPQDSIDPVDGLSRPFSIPLLTFYSHVKGFYDPEGQMWVIYQNHPRAFSGALREVTESVELLNRVYEPVFQKIVAESGGNSANHAVPQLNGEELFFAQSPKGFLRILKHADRKLPETGNESHNYDFEFSFEGITRRGTFEHFKAEPVEKMARKLGVKKEGRKTSLDEKSGIFSVDLINAFGLDRRMSEQNLHVSAEPTHRLGAQDYGRAREWTALEQSGDRDLPFANLGTGVKRLDLPTKSLALPLRPRSGDFFGEVGFLKNPDQDDPEMVLSGGSGHLKYSLSREPKLVSVIRKNNSMFERHITQPVVVPNVDHSLNPYLEVVSLINNMKLGIPRVSLVIGATTSSTESIPLDMQSVKQIIQISANEILIVNDKTAQKVEIGYDQAQKRPLLKVGKVVTLPQNTQFVFQEHPELGIRTISKSNNRLNVHEGDLTKPRATTPIDFYAELGMSDNHRWLATANSSEFNTRKYETRLKLFDLKENSMDSDENRRIKIKHVATKLLDKESGASALAVRNDGNLIAVGTSKGIIYIVGRKGNSLKTLGAIPHAAGFKFHQIRFSPDGETLIVVQNVPETHKGEAVKLWDLKSIDLEK